MDESNTGQSKNSKEKSDKEVDVAVSAMLKGVKAEIERCERQQMYIDFRDPGEHFGEIQGLVSEEELSKLMAKLSKIENLDGDKALQYLQLAVELKEVSPEWFAQNYNGSYSLKNFLLNSRYEIKNNPLNFLAYLNNFKTLFSELYAEEKEGKLAISDEMWDAIAEAIKEYAGNNLFDEFISNFAKAAFLDYEAISKRINLEEYWRSCTEYLEYLKRNPINHARLMSASQMIWSDKLDVVFSKQDWLNYKESLKDYIKKNRKTVNLVNEILFQLRAVKYLEVAD